MVDKTRFKTMSIAYLVSRSGGWTNNDLFYLEDNTLAEQIEKMLNP